MLHLIWNKAAVSELGRICIFWYTSDNTDIVLLQILWLQSESARLFKCILPPALEQTELTWRFHFRYNHQKSLQQLGRLHSVHFCAIDVKEVLCKCYYNILDVCCLTLCGSPQTIQSPDLLHSVWHSKKSSWSLYHCHYTNISGSEGW